MKRNVTNLFPCLGVASTRSRVLPVLIAGLGLMLAGRVTAQTFTNLHSFTGEANGKNPYAGLMLSGNTLYGVALASTSAAGTVFAINTDGTGFTNLHSFTGDKGAHPSGDLILSGNTLYGTAQRGGSSFSGTVFAVNTNGTGFTNLHMFTGSDGVAPYAGLVLSGNTLYGTASGGGSSGAGTVFAVNTDGTGFTNLHNFTATFGSPYPGTNSDGAEPIAGLILSGNTLYGTTYSGGSSGRGTVFAINTDGTGFTNLHIFTAYSGPPSYTNSDGANPYAGLILSGNTLYGTAQFGGGSGYGTVFALNTNGTGFANLHSFTGGGEGTDPLGGLIISGSTLYGTTYQGGISDRGTVFAVNTDGTGFTTLYGFTEGTGSDLQCFNSDGAYPYAGLVLSGNNLYGTAYTGGSPGAGTVFRLTLPPPQLIIAPSAANVVLTWPTYAPGVTLQSATNLDSSAVWTTISLAPVVVNGQNTVTNPISGTQQFYRLIQ